MILSVPITLCYTNNVPVIHFGRDGYVVWFIGGFRGGVRGCNPLRLEIFYQKGSFLMCHFGGYM